MVDVDQERQRLEGETREVDQQIARLQDLLNGPFAQKAPAEIVARERKKLQRFEAQKSELAARLADLR